MAERRMFTKKITESDAFLDMPSSAQMLYFHLSMNADDDGFVNNPKNIQRMCGAKDDDFKLILAKGFVILFDSGIIVIKHWRMHNYIRSDRYKPTDYDDEKNMLALKDNSSYTLINNGRYTDGIPMVSVGKDSIGKDSIDTIRRFTPPSVEEVKQYCLERHNGINAEEFVDFYKSKGWMIGKNKMKDWKACVRTWEKSRSKTESEPRTDYNEMVMNELFGGGDR